MPPLPPNIQARRVIEDRAAKLGVRRRGYETGLTRNTQEIIDLLRDADGSGVPLEALAALLGVSRQSLYNWREIAAKLQPGERAADMASRRNEDGHFLH